MHPLAWRMSDHLVSCFHNKLGYKRELTINTSKSRSMYSFVFYIKDPKEYYLHTENAS